MNNFWFLIAFLIITILAANRIITNEMALFLVGIDLIGVIIVFVNHFNKNQKEIRKLRQQSKTKKKELLNYRQKINS